MCIRDTGRWGKKNKVAHFPVQISIFHCSTSTCFVTWHGSHDQPWEQRTRLAQGAKQMAFRRLAQENYAASPKSTSSNSPALPTTPRNRSTIVSAYRSPAETPSISSSVPFDWEAARSRRPPPYGTPLQRARKTAAAQTPGSHPRKAVIRKKGLVER